MVNFQWESDWTNEDFIRIDIISGEEILEDAEYLTLEQECHTGSRS